MTMPVVLSPYPLSTADRSYLQETLGGSPTYKSVTELRRQPVAEMLRALRMPGSDRCVLSLPYGTGAPLRPLLHTVATLAGFRHIEAIGPEGRRERLSRRTAPHSVAALARASAANSRAVRAARRDLRGLVRASRAELLLGDDPGVLYLSANLWLGLQVGGSVGHTAGVANELTAAGHSVELASIAPPPLLDGRVRAVPLSPPATLGLPFEANSYRFSASIVRQLRPRLSHVGTGFIYQRLSVANYAGVVLSRQTGTPLVLEYNGSEAWTAMHWGTRLRYHELAVAAEDACLKHAHVVVTVSDVLRDELEKRGVEAERIACYPNGVDPERFDPTRVGPTDRRMLRSDLGIPSDAVVVGFIGTFGRWHGVDVLARAIRQMVTIDDEWLTANRVRFLLIGDGLLAADVDAILSAEPRCAQFVVRTGIVAQERAPALLAISDVVVSPHVPNPDGSRFFGSPTKLFEYMAAGKPIVASDLEQIGQVLTPSLRVGRLPPNEAGQDAVELAVLAKPADVNELVLGIRFLVEHPGWRQMLGENARFQVRRQYTWSHHVAAILERLRMVVPPQLALSARR